MKNTLRLLLSRARKHIAWQILVGVMACIGGITTIACLYNDVLVPVFHLNRELRREVELEDLLTFFTPSPDGTGLDWTTGARPDSPIAWATDERYGDVPNQGFFRRFSAARHGKTTVMIHGNPSHDQFDKTVHPAIWDVSMYGCMAEVECVQFSTEGSGYNERPNMVGAIAEHLQFKEKHPDSAYTFIGNLYSISLPGRQHGWLVESWSIGNHSWFLELTLFPGERSYPLAKEFLEKFL